MKTYIGIDNGVSGTIAIISSEGVLFQKTPVKKVQDYTKAKKMVTRLDAEGFYNLLKDVDPLNCFCLVERPMLNPTRWTASISAARCHEAMLNTIELLHLPYAFIDSKEWQRGTLPKGFNDGETKILSLQVGNRLFPQFQSVKHPDRDALLIAEYARKSNL